MSTAATITPEEVLQDVQSLSKPKPSAEALSFPIHVFPEMLATYAQELRRANGFEIDYTAAGMLFVASTAIGNAIHLKVKHGYHAPPILWLVCVGYPSIGKTHPLATMVAPLDAKDERSKRAHSDAMRKWEAEQESRRGKGKGNQPEEPPSAKPVWRPHILDDVTMEALVAKLAATPRGVGLHSDELRSWFEGMDKYRKGGDRQKWLSIFNGSRLTEIRKTAGEHFVKRPLVSVAGGIQPAVLSSIGRADDGFMHRMLFHYPDNQVKGYTSSASVSAEWGERWAEVVEMLLGLEMRPDGTGGLEPELLAYSTEAAQAHARWDRINVDRINAAIREGDELSASLGGKMDTYTHRLALVLEMLYRACEGKAHARGDVRLEAVEGALELVRYYTATARKVRFQLFEAHAADRLTEPWRKLYAALDDPFKTGDAIALAKDYGISHSTFKRRLNDTELFRREKHGHYSKRLEL